MLTLSSESLEGYGLNRIFAFVKEAGFDGIDITLDPSNFDTLNADYLHELIKTYNLPIVALQLGLNSSHRDILNAVEMAKKIEVKIIIVQPPRITQFREIQWFKTQIPKLRKKENLSIALENASPKTYFGIIPQRAMNNLVELKRFKHACLDTSRLAEKKEEIIKVSSLLKDYLVHIHLSNVYRGQGHNLPTKGILPLESFLTKLKDFNYKGAISLKILSKYLEAGNDERVMTNLKECKTFYEKYFLQK
ncbi:sugar phosphate isomerase/epimerase [Candidatus Peregrinibacteria bacterium]|nr:sugar phosphate isomerase/epimerase [Candidatus Peregrinibacteria bacterium]